MADAVNAAIKSLDGCVHYVPPPGTNAAPTAPDPNSRPFDILDYGTAATQIGSMAAQLTAVLQSANRSEAQVARLSRQATADAKGVVTHAFRLGVVLVVVIGSATVGVVWACRRFGSPAGKQLHS